jgi:membrane protein
MTFKLFWVLTKAAASSWVDDYAQSMGAALAYYTLFSVAPLLLIVISVAGLVFGVEAAHGEIIGQLRDLMGPQGAQAVQSLLEGVSKPAESITAMVIGGLLLLIGATSVFAELQDSLDRIWRAPKRYKVGIWSLLRARLLSFGMIMGIGFLLMVSLVVSAALAALGKLALRCLVWVDLGGLPPKPPRHFPLWGLPADGQNEASQLGLGQAGSSAV